MKYSVLIVMFFGLTALLSVANSATPTCEEEPTRRDCIKVEDPNAAPPKQTVKQKNVSPPSVQNPIAKPKAKAGK